MHLWSTRLNLLHHWLCGSSRWQRKMEQRVPWTLSGTELGTDVLEVGPGPGLTTDFLRARFQHLTALEKDALLAQALRLRMRGTNVKVMTGDAAAMPFPDATFSGCVMFTMLHHVPSPQLQDTVLREVRRVLRPGGEFAGSDSLQGTFMKLIHIGDTLVPVDPDGFHARLEAAGFEEIRIEKTSGCFRFFARRPDATAD